MMSTEENIIAVQDETSAGADFPATVVLKRTRAALLPSLVDKNPISFVWPMFLMGIVMLPLGLYLFQRAERSTKRTGKLKRND